MPGLSPSRYRDPMARKCHLRIQDCEIILASPLLGKFVVELNLWMAEVFAAIRMCGMGHEGGSWEK